MKADHVAVIEAAYRLEADEQSWLLDIARAACPLFHGGFNMASWTFGMTPQGDVSIGTRVTIGPPEFMDDMIAARDSFGQEALNRMVLDGPCKSVVEILGAPFLESTPEVRHVTKQYGLKDLLLISAADPTGHGVGIGLSFDAWWRGSPAFRRRWSRLAVHWAAGYRARRALAAAGIGGATAVLDSAEAVLTPGGKVAHASRDAKSARAREALRRAARAVDEARSRLRFRDADQAIDLWQGLFAGRWSLMDVFDSDGRRFVVARRNDPDVPARGGLSTRELQVLAYRAQAHPLKLIAYECGLSVGTVAGYLRSACNKLGVKTPAEIARLFSTAKGDAPP
jgi:DNA-binding CsgD family transcriptional regulator